MKKQAKELSAAVSNTILTNSPGDLDGYVTTADVCELTRYSRRWLNKLMHDRRFPKPDIPSSGTNTNRWRCSTIRKALDAMAGIAPSEDPE
jgi:predicted DNA-binding transcriptional regulator AlpA